MTAMQVSLPVRLWYFTDEEVQYDMLTSPITTPFFHHRVQELVRQALIVGDGRETQVSSPTVPPLSLPDTTLSPGGISAQLLALVSPWIDLCSPDPIIADVSRQVLYLEVAFAAFCGIEYIFVLGPRLYHGDARTHGTPQYARAIQEVISIAGHAQIHIMLPMVDDPSRVVDDPDSLALLAREECLDEVEELKPQKTDVYGTWDAWNAIRTVCKYHNRLSVGKKQTSYPLFKNHLSVLIPL